MKKPQVKKSVAALVIFNIIAILLWALLFVVLGSHYSGDGFVRFHLTAFGGALGLDFVKRTGPAIFTVLVYLGLLVTLILSIRATKKTGRKVVWPAWVLLVLSGLVAVELFANMNKYPVVGYVALLSNAKSSNTMLVTFGIIALALLVIIFGVAAWIVAYREARGLSEKKAQELAEEEAREEAAKEEEIRRIVREELEKRPQVIQNFYGVRPEQLVNNEDLVQEVKEQPKEEPKPEPKPEPKLEPKPAPAPVEEPEEGGKNQIIRIPFDERLVAAEKDLKENYNELKNEILAYGVKSRISNSGDTFRLHRKAFVKITIAGKGLKLYFALNPANYAESTIPVIDASDKAIYEETPMAFKVKSNLSVKRAKQLIADVMATEGLEREEPLKTDWVKQVRADLREEKKAAK